MYVNTVASPDESDHIDSAGLENVEEQFPRLLVCVEPPSSAVKLRKSLALISFPSEADPPRTERRRERTANLPFRRAPL